MLFGVGVWQTLGAEKAEEFFAGYLLEQSLSVDNLFVFILVFRYFRAPKADQDKVNDCVLLLESRCLALALPWFCVIPQVVMCRHPSKAFVYSQIQKLLQPRILTSLLYYAGAVLWHWDCSYSQAGYDSVR